jgi:hypothetical protein
MSDDDRGGRASGNRFFIECLIPVSSFLIATAAGGNHHLGRRRFSLGSLACA